jgi:hypothetical protein
VNPFAVEEKYRTSFGATQTSLVALMFAFSVMSYFDRTIGDTPYWRGDGKELFYLDGNKLRAVDVDGDGESFKAETPRQLLKLLWKIR